MTTKANQSRSRERERLDRVSELKEIFNRFDSDSDGQLTARELAGFLRCIGINDYDINRHHLLRPGAGDYVDFGHVVEAIAPETLLPSDGGKDVEVLRLFRAMDQDGNGYITAAKLAKSLARMGQKLSLRELTQMIRQADTDRDGLISLSEFASIMTEAAADPSIA